MTLQAPITPADPSPIISEKDVRCDEYYLIDDMVIENTNGGLFGELVFAVTIEEKWDETPGHPDLGGEREYCTHTVRIVAVQLGPIWVMPDFFDRICTGTSCAEIAKNMEGYFEGGGSVPWPTCDPTRRPVEVAS